MRVFFVIDGYLNCSAILLYMADDKGGGSSWSPIEIIIVLILVIALLSRLSGKEVTPITQVPQAANAPTITEQTGATVGCTVRVSKPKPLEVVTGDFVDIQGAAVGCGSIVGTNFSAVVVNEAGAAMSALTTVPLTYTDVENNLPFQVPVSFTTKPTTATGYIVITPASAIDGSITGVRVPIRFK